MDMFSPNDYHSHQARNDGGNTPQFLQVPYSYAQYHDTSNPPSYAMQWSHLDGSNVPPEQPAYTHAQSSSFPPHEGLQYVTDASDAGSYAGLALSPGDNNSV
ncbi:hypothetical protein EJ05DRAFT_474121 [Pseudovirgaria hyperparasitica]|uniref:Uncharacterized protein n=1 Tax=Pseudovirgaria hyperparasitica TaxID=470096 RepID=A0A6A6WC05_9PEZI|nr:uncharacterized protein EJ05DRAFT_474121 [Pseudovirgaria hyperparasitica]KAF2760233.1 hypothetical protein EJ05DRAFT_474121 [Pseudovirgaria hyperparasitica]